jgi:hypothetical protein
MSLSTKQRFDILKRDNFRCQYCGRTSDHARLEVDHIHPKSEGGSDDPGNLITACWECNSGKRASMDVIDTVQPKLPLKCSLPGCLEPAARGFCQRHHNFDMQSGHTEGTDDTITTIIAMLLYRYPDESKAAFDYFIGNPKAIQIYTIDPDRGDEGKE